jgi:hypothetical protein
MTDKWKHSALSLYCACWAGVVIGVSFVATVAKFSAPTLTRPVALDIGRHTFAALARIEWGLAVVLVLAIAYAGMNRFRAIMLFLIAALLAAETLWLYPLLSARTELVLAGQALPPSSVHAVSVAAESAKVLLLAVFALVESKTGRA